MMIQKQIFRNAQKGFTFVELLIVIAIIGILSSVVLVQTGTDKIREEVRATADELAAHIVDMRQRSLTGSTGDVNKACGFGVNVYSSGSGYRYRTFYTKKSSTCSSAYMNETITPTLFRWSNSRVAVDPVGGVEVDLFFSVPFGGVSGGGRDIVVKDTSSTYAQHVCVSSSGSVWVDDSACVFP